MGRHTEPWLLRKRKDTGYWFFKLAGWRLYKPTGTTVKADALDQVKTAIAKEAERRGAAGSLRAYSDPFYRPGTCPRAKRLQDEGRPMTDRHMKEQRRLLDNKILTDPIADEPFATLSRGQVLDFRGRLRAQGDSPRTINRTMGVGSSIYVEANLREDIDRNPFQRMSMHEEFLAVGIFTLEEYEALFPETAPGPWHSQLAYVCFFLAGHTGMRRGEIFELRWKDLDFVENVIHVQRAWKGGEAIGSTKTGKPREVPISSETAAVLQLLVEDGIRTGPEDLVICDDDGRRQDGVWWKRQFSYAMKALKIDARSRRLRPHSFRHTVNTRLRAAGIDPSKVRAMLGWSREVTQDGYTHWQAQDLRSLADELSRPAEGK